MPTFSKSAHFWTVAFGIWFIVLNILSHGSHLHAPDGWAFDIPHFDKIAHFGFFFGGRRFYRSGKSRGCISVV